MSGIDITEVDIDIVLTSLPSVGLLAAASSHTDDSATRALEEFGQSPRALSILRRMGYLIYCGGEWEMEKGLRAAVMSEAIENNRTHWNEWQHYYFRVAEDGGGVEQPFYMSSGIGLAYHGAEVNIDTGLNYYREVSHINSLAISNCALNLATEQTRRGLLDTSNSTLIFLRGMTYYRMGRDAEGIRLLRQLVNSSEPSREVAVAQHLVGHWDCTNSKGGGTSAAQSLMRASHKNAAKRNDKQHLSQVKHSMGVCMLKTKSPKLYDSAIRLLEQSLVLADELGDEWGRAMILHSLGRGLLKRRHSRGRARECLEESLRIGESLGYMGHVNLVRATLRSCSGGKSSRKSNSNRKV